MHPQNIHVTVLNMNLAKVMLDMMSTNLRKGNNHVVLWWEYDHNMIVDLVLLLTLLAPALHHQLALQFDSGAPQISLLPEQVHISLSVASIDFLLCPISPGV